MSVAYAGTYGDRLFDKSRDLNTAPPGPGFNTPSRRPYPQLQQVIAALSRGWMQDNSMQLRVERRTSKGFYLLGSYTYAQALTNGVSGFGGDPGIVYFPVVTTKDADKGLVEYRPAPQRVDQRLHVLPVGKGERYLSDTNGVVDAILGGWQVNGIFSANSGYPLGMSMSTNQSGTGFGNRPDRVCDGKLDDPDHPAVVRHQLLRRAGGGRARKRRTDDALRRTLERGHVAVEEVHAAAPVPRRDLQRLQPRAVPDARHDGGFPTFGVIQSTVKSSRQVQFAFKDVF